MSRWNDPSEISTKLTRSTTAMYIYFILGWPKCIFIIINVNKFRSYNRIRKYICWQIFQLSIRKVMMLEDVKMFLRLF